MSNARNRPRRPGRRPPFRDVKPRILIVSEGEVTEPEYFKGFIKACRNPRVEIVIAPEQGVPKSCVSVAKERKQKAEADARREKDDNLAYDSVWCVFDVDEHPQVGEAKKMAQDNDIRLAVSNPCIELWLLLHFRDNPGMKSRHQIKEMLTYHVPGYNKHVNYETYAAGYSLAAVRAERMDQAAENAGESGRNPTTGVYQLTNLIRGD